MLDRYDAAKVHASGKPVNVLHGHIAEAAFRDYLSGFLPKRFGVTSGFIVSQGVFDSEPLRHFDVIIYDQINSPILWVEPNPDQSAQGRIRAIPAENVCAVLEVKSRFTAATAKQAIQKLEELRPLLSGSDHPADPYPRYLPSNFLSYTIFFELQKQDARSTTGLQTLVLKTPMRGYAGALILRGERLGEMSARASWLLSAEPLRAQGELLKYAVTPSRQAGDQHTALVLNWSHSEFALFSFELVTAMTNRHPGRGRMPSFHGVSYTR